MKYEVHLLKLYQPLVCGIQEDNGNGRIVMCESVVTKKNMNPKPEEYIRKDENDSKGPKSKDGIIPAGNYFFVQGFLQAEHKPFILEKPSQELAEAAQALYLEFIWQEKNPANKTVYLRILHEDIKKSAGEVFQLFRLISN